LRMIAGLETPTEGKITIGDTVVFDSSEGINVPPAKRNVGFLFQNYALWPHMSVYDNVAFGLKNLKWKKEDIDKRVCELLEMLKISQFAKRYPNEISGGQQQRVAIARTLAPSPKVLFMDEPLSNLDAKLRLEMRSELKRLHLDTNSTFVYVTHDQLEAMTLATEVCLIKEGVIQQYEAPLQLYTYPKNIFVADFVGNPTMNFIDSQAKEIKPMEFEVDFAGVKTMFIPNEPMKLKSSNVVLGIRPEYIKIVKDSNIKGKVYATLPAGMETTIKFRINDQIMTSVVFGIIDFKLDSEIAIDFIGSNVCLFDKDTGESLGLGKLVNCSQK
ncbi:MAG: ABC transporter ATP-binding protein, partial [Bacilli bacterium]|nr:ABC transporter ATP-binding protein [Bacilli bacterium]